MSGLNIFLFALAISIGLVGLFTLGFAISPRPYRAHPVPTHLGELTPMQPDIPEPVRRHFTETVGAVAPRIDTAVVWGRGRFCVRGVWIPLRYKTWYRAGDAYFRRMEGTFFTRPVMSGTDRYVQGQGDFSLGEQVEHSEEGNRSQALVLWAEMVWLPSVLVQDPQIRWEMVDEHSARLAVPVGTGIERLLFHFDPLTGRMTHLEGTRLRPESGEQEPWRMDLLAWKEFQGMLIPEQISVAWGESGSPWSYWTLDGVAYNVHVDDQLGERRK
jgi:hypothetical protein